MTDDFWSVAIAVSDNIVHMTVTEFARATCEIATSWYRNIGSDNDNLYMSA
jgi:hypothetical protein